MIDQIHIINGPNLNLLGKRSPEIYGHISFETFLSEIKQSLPGIQIHYYQSNHEGQLIDYLHQVGFEGQTGIVINPGAYTHTSIAIRDAIEAIKVPVIEVHISDIYSREPFRRINYIKDVVEMQYCGFGLKGYTKAIEYFIDQKFLP